jgi:hypothetical protein
MTSWSQGNSFTNAPWLPFDLIIHSNFCKFRFQNPVRYIHYPSKYCYFLESIQDLPFQELFEFAIFDAGIYFVDALRYLA